MVQVAKLTADLTANTSRFEQGLKRANGAMNNSKNRWGSALKQSENSFDSLGAKALKLGGILASALAVRKLIGDFSSVVNKMDDMSDAADRIGISVESFSRLAYAADIAEVPVTTLEGALRKLQVQLGEGGTDKFNEALKAIGLSVTEITTLGADEAFIQIAGGINQLSTANEKAAVQTALFGKNSKQLFDLIKLGPDQIRALTAEAEKFGVVIGSDAAEKAERFKESLVRVQAAYEGFIIKLADSGAIEVFTDLVLGLANALVVLRNSFKAIREFSVGFDETTKEGLGRAIDSKIEELRTFEEKRTKVGDWLDKQIGVDKGKMLLEQQLDLRTRLARMSLRQNEIDKANPVINPPKTVPGLSGGGGGKSKKDEDKTVENILSKLREESEEIDVQVKLWGQKESAVSRARKEIEINNQLTKAGIQLTEEQRTQMDGYLDQIQQQSTIYDELEKQQKKIEEKERDRAQAIEQLGYTFESAFEDAILSGEKFSDVLTALANDVMKLMFRMTVTKPLFDAIGGEGGLGDIFGDFVGSFASGTDHVPRTGMAMVHKGEMIIPADEVADFKNGGNYGGGTKINVNISNNNNSRVSTNSQKNGNGTDLNIMLDQAIAEKIATPGSKTQQALQAARNRSIIRR